jgi:hypothetical protein
MSTERILADHDRATDVGVAATTCPVAWYCPECGEPCYVGEPDDRCVECGEGVRFERDQTRAQAQRVLASDLLAGVVATARAEALREAADTWQTGDWSNVLLPKPTPPAVPVIAYSNRVLDWLRARAAREATQ